MSLEGVAGVWGDAVVDLKLGVGDGGGGGGGG